jgi:hypothetical protein
MRRRITASVLPAAAGRPPRSLAGRSDHRPVPTCRGSGLLTANATHQQPSRPIWVATGCFGSKMPSSIHTSLPHSLCALGSLQRADDVRACHFRTRSGLSGAKFNSQGGSKCSSYGPNRAATYVPYTTDGPILSPFVATPATAPVTAHSLGGFPNFSTISGWLGDVS